MEKKVLIIEDDLAFGTMLQRFLQRNDNYRVSLVTSGEEARLRLAEKTFDLLITDLKLPDDSGMELLKLAQQKKKPIPTILMTGYADVSTAVEAIKRGAVDYISKPFRPEELLMIIEQAIEPVEKKEEKESQMTKPPTTPKASADVVLGNSSASKTFNKHLRLVAPTEMCVLIEGESGTGKEVAAQTIHEYSERRDDLLSL